MNAIPLYQAHNLHPAYALRYSWAAFPLRGESFPDQPHDSLLADLTPLWDRDGIRLLEHLWTAGRIQVTFSTKPDVAPMFLAARAKGRMQHGLRSAGLPVKFARNFSVRALGNNTRETAEEYVRTQVARGKFADGKYRDRLEASTWTDPAVDLSKPVATSSGRYWYNLHVVLVTSDRYRLDAGSSASVLRETCRAVANKHGYRLSAVSVMPDHLHMAVQGVPEKSPQDIVLEFQNNTAWKLGQIKIWEHGYYAGTMGEYTMRAVRQEP